MTLTCDSCEEPATLFFTPSTDISAPFVSILSPFVVSCACAAHLPSRHFYQSISFDLYTVLQVMLS